MSESIKESIEILDALKGLASVVSKIGKDGKVSFADLPYLGEAVKAIYDVVSESKDKDQALKELKDLDQAELISIVGKVYEIIEAGKGK